MAKQSALFLNYITPLSVRIYKSVGSKIVHVDRQTGFSTILFFQSQKNKPVNSGYEVIAGGSSGLLVIIDGREGSLTACVRL